MVAENVRNRARPFPKRRIVEATGKTNKRYSSFSHNARRESSCAKHVSPLGGKGRCGPTKTGRKCHTERRAR
eukprot:7242800-Lingulodinium_polyedra.AAC.1